jgi:hypothetical protein
MGRSGIKREGKRNEGEGERKKWRKTEARKGMGNENKQDPTHGSAILYSKYPNF